MKNKKFSSALKAWKEQKDMFKDTALGKHIMKVRSNLEADLGGRANMTQSQHIVLDRITEKLFILGLMGAHIHMSQDEIITEDGELMPCLRSSFLPYSNSIRLDILALAELSRQTTHRSKVDLDTYVQRKYGGKKDETG